jgi:hypothetical protein
VDNFVDSYPATAAKARKIKGLAPMPAKRAYPQFVQNQQLTSAIGFVARPRIADGWHAKFCA